MGRADIAAAKRAIAQEDLDLDGRADLGDAGPEAAGGGLGRGAGAEEHLAIEGFGLHRPTIGAWRHRNRLDHAKNSLRNTDRGRPYIRFEASIGSVGDSLAALRRAGLKRLARLGTKHERAGVAE